MFDQWGGRVWVVHRLYDTEEKRIAGVFATEQAAREALDTRPNWTAEDWGRFGDASDEVDL